MEYQLLCEVAQQFGTPTYVYDASRIQAQYEHLMSAFKACQAKFFYACKALSNINVLKIIKNLGAGLDCVSINEVKLGLHAGFEPHQIMFTPNSVGFEEIEEALSLGVHINIDNISNLERFGKKYSNSYPIFIRINPHIEAGGNYKISTGHIDSKFGISIHQIRHVQRIIKATNLNVEGLHVHTGSEIKDPNVFIQALDLMLDLAEDFPNLKYIDMGSGFKVPYAPQDVATDIQLLGTKLHERMQAFKMETGREMEIWFEPGKFLVSDCGVFLVKVNILKPTMATVFAGVDSGFNHLIRPMFYDAYHEIENVSNPAGVHRIYTVVGNICETDTFAWDRSIAEIREQDILAFKNAGAYGFEMSSFFNSRNRPAEVLYHNGQIQLIRRRTDFNDLLRDQFDVIED